MPNEQLRPTVTRRTLLTATAAASALGMMGLTGCQAKTLAQTTSLKDKRVKTASSFADATADEPKISVKILATPTFRGVIPALVSQFGIDHANLNFVDPVYVEGGKLLETIEGGGYDMVFSDVESPIKEAEKAGVLDEGSKLYMWNSYLNIVASVESNAVVQKASNLESSSIQTIAFCDDENSISGVFARQFLSSYELYSNQTGLDGSFADSINDKVRTFSTVTEMTTYLVENPSAVGFLMEPELLLEQQLTSVFEVPRMKHRTVSYQSAVFKSSSQMAAGIVLLQWCKQDTRAFRTIAAHGFHNE